MPNEDNSNLAQISSFNLPSVTNSPRQLVSNAQWHHCLWSLEIDLLQMLLEFARALMLLKLVQSSEGRIQRSGTLFLADLAHSTFEGLVAASSGY